MTKGNWRNRQEEIKIYFFREERRIMDIGDGNNGNNIMEISVQETGTYGLFFSEYILLLGWIDSMKKSLFILLPSDALALCSLQTQPLIMQKDANAQYNE